MLERSSIVKRFIIEIHSQLTKDQSIDRLTDETTTPLVALGAHWVPFPLEYMGLWLLSPQAGASAWGFTFRIHVPPAPELFRVPYGSLWS